MKKKRANSGFLRETRMNQGAATSRKRGMPVARRISLRRLQRRARSR
jgi:hypothetical protein